MLLRFSIDSAPEGECVRIFQPARIDFLNRYTAACQDISRKFQANFFIEILRIRSTALESEVYLFALP
jgi:hypothetical protein